MEKIYGVSKSVDKDSATHQVHTTEWRQDGELELTGQETRPEIDILGDGLLFPEIDLIRSSFFNFWPRLTPRPRPV